MFYSDDATPDEVAEMAAEQRELRRLWLNDPRIVMAQVVQPDRQQHQVPVWARLVRWSLAWRLAAGGILQARDALAEQREAG